MLEAARRFIMAFLVMVVRLVEPSETDVYVEFRWHWSNTNTGLGGTRNAVDLRIYERWTLNDDDVILELLRHVDEADCRRQLHAGAAPAATWPRARRGPSASRQPNYRARECPMP